MRILLPLVAVFGLSASALAQVSVEPIEVTPFAGYLFGGSFLNSPTIPQAGFDQISLANHLDYGVRIGFNLSPAIEPEIQWSRSETHLVFTPSYPNFSRVDSTIDYFLVGASYNFSSGNIRPYVSLSLGADTLSVNTPPFALVGLQLAPATTFAVSVGVGVKMFVTSNFGFRLEARGYGSEVPSSYVASCTAGPLTASCFRSWLLNGDLTGGLVIAF